MLIIRLLRLRLQQLLQLGGGRERAQVEWRGRGGALDVGQDTAHLVQRVLLHQDVVLGQQQRRNL